MDRSRVTPRYSADPTASCGHDFQVAESSRHSGNVIDQGYYWKKRCRRNRYRRTLDEGSLREVSSSNNSGKAERWSEIAPGLRALTWSQNRRSFAQIVFSRHILQASLP